MLLFVSWLWAGQYQNHEVQFDNISANFNSRAGIGAFANAWYMVPIDIKATNWASHQKLTVLVPNQISCTLICQSTKKCLANHFNTSSNICEFITEDLEMGNLVQTMRSDQDSVPLYMHQNMLQPGEGKCGTKLEHFRYFFFSLQNLSQASI